MSIPLTKKWKTVFRQISEANVLEGKSSGSEDQKVNKGFLKKIPDSAEAALVLEGKLPGIIIIIFISIIIILSLKASFPACSNLSPSSSAWKRQLCFQLCLRWMFLQGLESRDSVAIESFFFVWMLFMSWLASSSWSLLCSGSSTSWSVQRTAKELGDVPTRAGRWELPFLTGCLFGY